MTVSYASHISASVTKEKRAFFCPSAPAPCGVGIFTKEMKVGSETVTGAGRQCPDKLMRAYSHLENGSTIFLYRKDRPLVSIRPDVPAPPQPTEPSNSVSSSVESDACPSEPAVATSAVAPQVEEALIGRAVQTSEETSSLKPPSAPPNTAFPTKNDLWYTVPELQLGEERDVDVRPKWARLAGCGISEEPRVATSEETSSLKPPSAPPNAAFPTKNDLWYTVPQIQLGEERDVEVRPKWARLAGCGSENQFPTVFASLSDLDQEDFPMENLPSPAPVSAPVSEEPRVAALPSPAPVSAPVPEEPRVAALPSPAPVSAPVPEEPRVATSEETSSLKPPSAPPNAFPAKNDLWYTVPQLQLGEERDVDVRPKWARLAGCGIPEEPRVATSEETSSLKPPSAPPNAAFPTKNDLWYTVPKLQLGEERDVDVRPKWARLAGFPEEPRVATSEETSSLKLPSAPPNAAFPTKNDLWYTVPKLQLGEERDVDVRPKWARLAGFPEEPRVATSEETSSLKLPSAPPNAAFPTKNDLWYTVPLCTTDKKDVDSDLYHHKREDIMETETSLSERAETLVFDLVRLSGSGSVSAEFQFKVGLTLVRFAETSRLACRLARETMDRWIFRLQREGRWGRKLKDLSRFIVRFPTVFASPSDLDQEDFPMEDLSLDEENEDHPLPVPVVAPVPEEPRVAALPSPDPGSAPVPEEPRFAALPSPAPVSAPVPEEPRVAALPSPAPVSAPVPEEPRVSALHSPAPVSAPVPEEPQVAALPSPAPVSAPVPEEPRVSALHSPAPVSAPVPEEPGVAALPSPAPVSAPVPVEPRVASLHSPAPVSAPVPEELRVAALPSPAPVSAPVPVEPRVAALPSPAPVSAPLPEEPLP
ncbi:uncharacterized protein [Misgurnus anguillicaudatus]|uniref:uncharacterized protein n=1 Tax=Misgurnus anguillicaudatus TaxID=75329 RepID=UPI003CCF91C8